MKQAIADLTVKHSDLDLLAAVPSVVPTVADARLGVAYLEAKVEPVTRKHASFCFAKIARAMNHKMTKEEGNMLFETWIEATGDLPGDLWSEATLGLIQGYKFGMPRPAHLRELVEETFSKRRANLANAKRILAKLTAKPTAPPFVKDSIEAREIALRDSLRRVGQTARAAVYERQIAAREKRDVESWVNELVSRETTSITTHAIVESAIKRSPETQAKLNRSLARSWRDQGFTERAAQLERQADALAPIHREEPVT